MVLSKLSVNLSQHKKTSKRETSPIHEASPSLIPNGSPAGSCAGQGLCSLSQSLSYTAAPTTTHVPGAKERRPLSPAVELTSSTLMAKPQSSAPALAAVQLAPSTGSCNPAATQGCLGTSHCRETTAPLLAGKFEKVSFLLEPSHVPICHSEARNHLMHL